MASSSGGARKSSSGSGKKSTSRKTAAHTAKNSPQPIRREVGAAVCLFLGIFAAIGYFNAKGLFIEVFCGVLQGLLGWGFYFVPPALFIAAAILFLHRGRPVAWRVTFALLLPLVVGAMAHLLFASAQFAEPMGFGALIKSLYTGGKEHICGGVLSGLIAVGLELMFSVYGAFAVLLAAFVFLVMAASNLSFARLRDWWNGREHPQYIPEPEKPQTAPIIPAAQPAITGEQPVSKKPKHGRKPIDIPVEDTEPISAAETPSDDFPGFKSFDTAPKVQTPAEAVAEPDARPVEPVSFGNRGPDYIPIVNMSIPSTDSVKPASKTALKAEVDAEAEQVAEAVSRDAAAVKKYEFPPIDLLRKSDTGTVDGREEITVNRERLSAALRDFGVQANIVAVTRGPTVTRYDLELANGVKLNKLTNLSNDLALSLGVTSVRIAPIPDRISTVGIEVPNKLVSIVYLRDIIESPTFKNAASSLSFGIGKNIAGDCVVGNVAKLPHLLIAGTTGSGKSVCINSLLLSLLYKSSPEDVKLIMIDPKMVELGVYNGIPHLFVPVVTEPKKAAGALQWAVIEMLKRYHRFSEVGVRDLTGYNAYQKKNGGDTLPQVVIVVDELADLMLCAAKEVEESICRVAQMGRASGMHLVIATQRPSADVITGLMKANIPSRIAFAVSSAMESRIILDSQGAEKLIGMGDMLYSPLGSGKPVRIQGAFVSDEEREDVIDFIKQNSDSDYSDEVSAQIDKASEDKKAASQAEEAPTEPVAKSNYDELLPQAVDVLFETKQASVSMLQRRLKLGYSRAARIIDQMEEMGIVGPFAGSKSRELLITKQQWQEMQYVTGTAPTERFETELEFGSDSVSYDD